METRKRRCRKLTMTKRTARSRSVAPTPMLMLLVLSCCWISSSDGVPFLPKSAMIFRYRGGSNETMVETNFTVPSITKEEAGDRPSPIATSQDDDAEPSKKKSAELTEMTNRTRKKPKRQSTTSSTANTSSSSKDAAALRRIKREWRDAVELGIAYDWAKQTTISSKSSSDGNETTTRYTYVRMGPWGKNLLRWHFSVLGPPNSEYEGGIYHGRVLLPRDYPGSPPRVQMLTPSGRFIPGADICLSASAFHPESWTPRWTLLSLIDALRLHMLTTANEIGGKDASPDERRKYARQSREWILGRSVNHRRMIQAGIFSLSDNDQERDETKDVVDTDQSTKSSIGSTPKQQATAKSATAFDDESDGGVMVAPVKQTAGEVHVQRRMTRQITLTQIVIQAVVEVLTSPPRLIILALLTVFVILNRH